MRNYHEKPISKGELHKMSQRITEIEKVLDMDAEEDIAMNLDAELEAIEFELERSLKATLFRERGLKLIQGGRK